LIGFSTIVSRITSLLLEIQNMRHDTTQELWKLRRYFRQNRVPTELARRILRYLEYHEEERRRTVQESDLPLLRHLTKELRNQLHYVNYMQSLREHPLMKYLEQLSDVTMHRICESALQEKPLAERDPLFFQGDWGQHMDVVARGEIFYVQKAPGSKISTYDADSQNAMSEPMQSGKRSTQKKGLLQKRSSLEEGMRKVIIKKDMALGEGALFMPWRYSGDAYAVAECFVISLNARAFYETVQRCPYVHCYVGKYAQALIRVFQKAERKGQLSDVSDMQDTQNCVDKMVNEQQRKEDESAQQDQVGFYSSEQE